MAVTSFSAQSALTRLFCWAAIGMLCGLSGCAGTYRGFLQSVGPDYCRPVAPVSEAWVALHDPRVSPLPPNDRQWWAVFQDPTLDQLIHNAYEQNLNLKAAGARVLEARAISNIAHGNLFPQQQQAFGSAAQVAQSGNLRNRNVNERWFDAWEAGLTATWELDFWGRYRRTIESTEANYDASIEDYDDALVLLLGEVAETYISVQSLNQRVHFTEMNIEQQERSKQLAQARLGAGRGTELDVSQAESNLTRTAATLPSLKAELAQAKYRLCVLMGMPPSDIDNILANSQGIPTAPAEVALGIPAELVRRRPDVRRAERLLAAQSAKIGIAAADLYPQIAISGTIGYNSNGLSNLFEPESLIGAIGPAFRWNILNYGRIRNRIEAEKARFTELAALYQQSVLEAALEVESRAVSFTQQQDRSAILQQSVQAAHQSVELAFEQYNAGQTDFDRIFNLQRVLAVQQDELAATQGVVSQQLVGVYVALGGGWQIRLDTAGTR